MLFGAAALIGLIASALPIAASPLVAARQAAAPALQGDALAAKGAKQVFAHFMVGIVEKYDQPAWEADMKLAGDYGITGFALNIGTDSYTDTQLALAFKAAEATQFKLFISFDFNWFPVNNTKPVVDLLTKYITSPATYTVGGAPFVSTFYGEGFDWAAVEKAVGKSLYVVPSWPTPAHANDAGVAGLMSWHAWSGQIDNKPVAAPLTNATDVEYIKAASAVNKVYMAPVSPWFFTHYGPEVDYPKNWLFKSEALWTDRWNQMLSMGAQGLEFIELVTWNDFGESHYLGPSHKLYKDDGASKWTGGFDHVPMLDLAVPFIKAFKEGNSAPIVDSDQVVYWHRPHLKAASCNATDNCKAPPLGWDLVEDVVFVATMTTGGGSVKVTSGNKPVVTQDVPAGIQVFTVPMGVGEQVFELTTPTGTKKNSSAIPISDKCWNGIYNFNFHSGLLTVTPSPSVGNSSQQTAGAVESSGSTSGDKAASAARPALDTRFAWVAVLGLLGLPLLA